MCLFNPIKSNKSGRKENNDPTYLNMPIGPCGKQTPPPVVTLGPRIRHGVPSLVIEVPLQIQLDGYEVNCNAYPTY